MADKSAVEGRVCPCAFFCPTFTTLGMCETSGERAGPRPDRRRVSRHDLRALLRYNLRASRNVRPSFRSMRHCFLTVTGFVLAGGASRRMGRDKAKLLLGDETMVERQLRLLRSVCRSAVVLGPPANLAGITSAGSPLPCWPDELPGRGPLGGLYTGLRRTRTDFNLFLSCDLPFMETPFLHMLCQRALECRADVTVPESRDHGREPLCAVYRRRALAAIRKSLAAAEYKVDRFFSRVRCEVVPWSEIARAGFAPRIFANMNTPEDYEAAKAAIAVRNL